MSRLAFIIGIISNNFDITIYLLSFFGTSFVLFQSFKPDGSEVSSSTEPDSNSFKKLDKIKSKYLVKDIIF